MPLRSWVVSPKTDSTSAVDQHDNPLLLGRDDRRKRLDTGGRSGMPDTPVAVVQVPTEAVER